MGRQKLSLHQDLLLTFSANLKMSLFKEKDDFITQALKQQFGQESESSDSEAELGEQSTNAEVSPNKRLKLDQSAGSPLKETGPPQEESKVEYVCLEDSSNSNQIIEISSSDDEDTVEAQNISIGSNCVSSAPEANISIDGGDNEFNLKLIIAGSYQQFPTTYKTKLCQALKCLLDDLRQKGRSLVITHQSEEISLEETPQSLKLTPGIILKAIEVTDTEGTNVNPDAIRLTLQDGNKRHTKEFSVIKTDPFSKLKQSYMEEFKLDQTQRVKFLFDGDIVDDESTPEELEVEDGCVIDVMIG